MDFLTFLNRLLGDPNEKELKRLRPGVLVVRDRAAQSDIRSLTLETIPKKSEELKARIQEYIRKGDTERQVLDKILPEAFSVAIRACELLTDAKAMASLGRQEFLWNMIPFDVQILGGIVLHRGNISEMKTGEGKTLVCTLPVYLNALLGKGVHVVTVNDYLARRDSTWMGLLYNALGLTVGVIVHGKTTEERRAAYNCDITYGTNNEYGFDYLRDNMATSIARQVQRGLQYAIVDEVDSILIDEARTPLIISQPAEESTTKYMQHAQLVRNLEENVHFNRDEKQRAAVLTDEGIKKMEELLGVENIYTERGFEEVHHIEQALRAYAIYKRDVDYVVKPSTGSGQGTGEVIIVDEFTGRLMPGRRYGHGLHQAIEAKEGVEVQRESKTLATITFQNYFRLYRKLAGMTGTAKTEEEEFESIYKLRTLVIPTHRAMVRSDKADSVYRTVSAKFKAVAKIAKEMHAKGQPVLIGTTSIEKSEAMSLLLQEQGIPHQVLNAKQHEKEAEIIANAGQKGAVTIATNMAGRGTDIKLGEGVQGIGGLAILGTERHEARRIDNQLRGRSGRQGDPGESQFFVSMEDDLMRLFGGDRLKAMMERLKVPDDVPLENTIVSRSIESAQKKVEGHHFDTRRHVLQYDDVMNKHRNIMYQRRQRILEKMAATDDPPSLLWSYGWAGSGQRTLLRSSGTTEGQAVDSAVTLPLHADVLESLRKEARQIIASHAQGEDSGQWDIKEIRESLAALHAPFAQIVGGTLQSIQEREKLEKHVEEMLIQYYEDKCKKFPEEIVARAEALITLRAIDTHWTSHIDDMAHLREQVAFSGFAQRDPLIEYQDQGFRRFALLLSTIEATIVRALLQADFNEFAGPQVMVDEEESENLRTNEDQIEAELTHTGVSRADAAAAAGLHPIEMPRQDTKTARIVSHVGRNDPCPCGSGKKYKKCHGKNA